MNDVCLDLSITNARNSSSNQPSQTIRLRKWLRLQQRRAVYGQLPVHKTGCRKRISSSALYWKYPTRSLNQQGSEINKEKCLIVRVMTVCGREGIQLQSFLAYVLYECEFPASHARCINHLKTKCRLFYLKIQFVPRSKYFSSRL